MRVLVPVLLGVCLAACSRPAPGGSESRPQPVTAEGGLEFLGPVDGNVTSVVAWPPGRPADARPEAFLVTTGRDGGRDQGCVLLRGPAGEERARYVCSGETPYADEDGRPIRQVQHPEPGLLAGVPSGDRWMVSVLTRGSASPSSLVLLDVDPDSGLEERAVLWNLGHFEEQAFDSHRLAAIAYDNRQGGEQAKYGSLLVVLDLPPVASRPVPGEERTVVIPRVLGDGTLLAPPVRWVVQLPLDHPYGDGGRHVAIESSRAVVRLDSGLRYEFDPATGGVEVAVEDRYRGDWPLRRSIGPDTAAVLEQHLEDLRRRVRVHGRR